VRSDPWGGTLPEDMARQEANYTENERHHMHKQKERLKGIAWAAAMAWAEETTSKLESSGEDEGDEDEAEGEGEIIFPHAPLAENLPWPGDLFGR
jgi:hypothetical protein